MTMVEKIKERLAPLRPYKIILFGSQAGGNAGEESDIDIYVITRDDYIPRSWSEHKRIWLPYSKALRDLQKERPIDLIVHTKAMAKRLFDSQSLFAKELQKGIEL